MDRNAFAFSKYLRANSPRRNSQPTLSSHLHPALSYPTDSDSIHHSLDLSFQQSIAISRLDRNLIDNLCRSRR
ncbi:MAG: hypothetical protein WBY53_03135 [Acidobacteriaceae bacterium]